MSRPEPRYFKLEALQEYRFELERHEAIAVRLNSGTAEIFGYELAKHVEYGFSDEARGAIFSWEGAELEIGQPSTEYIGEETPIPMYLNLHLAIESMRIQACPPSASTTSSDIPGPRVLIVGHSNTGKTSLAKILTNWAIRSGREGILFVNLDPSEGALTIPGTVAVASVSALLPTTTPAVPFGITPTTGAAVQGNTPEGATPGQGTNNVAYHAPARLETFAPTLSILSFFYGHLSYTRNEEYGEALVEKLSGIVKRRIEQSGDENLWKAGVIVDTPGEWTENKEKGWAMIKKAVRDLDITIMVVIGNEKLNIDMSRLMKGSNVQVVRVTKSGGITDQDTAYRRRIQLQQIRAYFYGGPRLTQGVLSPFSFPVRFDELKIYRVGQESLAPSSALPIGAQRQISKTQLYEVDMSIPRSATDLASCVLALSQVSDDAPESDMLLSPVLTFVHLTSIDTVKKKFIILSPLKPLPRMRAIAGTVQFFETE
ncbi:hypothetical protein BT69DRAFT_1255674 [Atractiella rhizophila]|nr:hypothetical protein BT69DRAFT_1255674 [Atractiella rhizophila]